MAEQEKLDLIQQEIEIWNTWRAQHKETCIDLYRAKLSKAKLSRADLMEVDLSRADLIEADLSKAILISSNLFLTKLDRANLSGADLSRANLVNAKLSEADLTGANLSGADLSRANLSGADLNGAYLDNTRLSGANLTDTNLSNTIVEQTTFGNLDLRKVKGLETIRHRGPSTIGTDTLLHSHGEIPEIFLRGAGLDDTFIGYVHSLTNTPVEYYTCFISYSSKDEPFARRLHNDLQQEGVRCWFAPEDMNIGDKIKHRIDESIRLYDKLLLILSESSITSNWVAYEVERALNKEPHGVPNVLYPVRVDQGVLTCTEPWARDIKSTRHIGSFEKWTDPQQYEKSFKRLLHALNTKKEGKKN